jgi:hypothetical protein
MTLDISKSIEACADYYGDDKDAMRDYLLTGQKKALELDNRGPIRFDESCQLEASIREAYSRYGFIFSPMFSMKRNSKILRSIWTRCAISFQQAQTAM